MLGKPGGPDEAADFLELLSGRRHRVFTAIALRRGGIIRSRCIETAVQFKRLSQGEIAGYLATREWRGKAGGYAIQGAAAAFIPRINGSYTNVVGLPLAETVNMLAGLGYRRTLRS
jgi:septum formation protein